MIRMRFRSLLLAIESAFLLVLYWCGNMWNVAVVDEGGGTSNFILCRFTRLLFRSLLLAIESAFLWTGINVKYICFGRRIVASSTILADYVETSCFCWRRKQNALSIDLVSERKRNFVDDREGNNKSIRPTGARTGERVGPKIICKARSLTKADDGKTDGRREIFWFPVLVLDAGNTEFRTR